MNISTAPSTDLASAFMQCVTAESGKVLSRRFSNSYLERTIPDLLSEIMMRTAFLDDSYEIRERVFFLQNNIMHAPICVVCGAAVHVKASGGWDKAKHTDVCSAKCWAAHPNKADILKNAFKNRDETASKLKREKTMVSKFGVGYTLQRPEMKEKLKKRLNDTNPEAYSKLSNKTWVEAEYIDRKRPLTHIAEELGCYYGTVGEWVLRHGFDVRSNNGATSYTEIECREYVQSLGFQVIENDRDMLPSRKELDIYIPSKNLAVEIDGIFWHSFKSKETPDEKRSHINKTIEANSQGIQLLHFWCSEWNEKKDIVKSSIAAKLGISTRIYARKCKIKEIQPTTARAFLDANHLAGFNGATCHIGLFYDDKLVHVTSFGTSRYSSHTWEIIRSASLLSHTIVGGLGKCFSYFVRNKCAQGDTILSYADRRYATGDSYRKIGFAQVEDSAIGYWWVKNDVVENRMRYQKHMLPSRFSNVDMSKSEAEIMFENGYRRLWDCGNLKFEYIVS